ncbi:DUF6192 family protein [Nonomuraea wenchangensis]
MVPWHEKSKTHRWTQDAAKREVGQRVNHPTTVQEKVNKVHDLLEDEQVAARVATDLLRRPQVVSEVVEDQTGERVHANLARVRGATECIGQAIDTRRPVLCCWGREGGFVW